MEKRYFAAAMLMAMGMLAIAGCSGSIPEAQFTVGRSLYRSHQFKAAITEFDKAIKLQPDNAEYYLYRGMAKIGNSNEIDAQADLDKAIALNPKYEQAYMERALLARFKDGKYEKPGVALQNINQVLRLNPHNDSAYYWLGVIRGEEMNVDSSLAAFDHYLKDHPKSYNGYMQRAMVKSINDKEGAISDYTKAIQLKPQSAEAYFSRGTCKLNNDDAKGAKADWLKAGELGYPDVQQAIQANDL